MHDDSLQGGPGDGCDRSVVPWTRMILVGHLVTLLSMAWIVHGGNRYRQVCA